jgi:hypothetical protein
MENNHTHEHINLTRQVLDKIETGEVSMKSKSYFTLKTVAVVFLTFLIACTLTLLISFVFFSLEMSEQLSLLGFGFRGVGLFIMLFPWWIFLLNAVLLLILERLLIQFRFAYAYPLVYVFLGTVCVVTVLGYAVTYTPLHQSLLERAQEKRLPVVGSYYEHARDLPPGKGVYRGQVLAIEGNTFIIGIIDLNTASATYRVVGGEGVDIDDFLDPGDVVFVAGNMNRGSIEAYGIKKVISR